MSEPVFHLDSDLNPTGVSIPCPAKVKAVLGLPSPVMLPCGLLDGHDGPHRYRIEWGAGAATHRNLSALSASSNDSGSVPVSGGDRARIEQRGAERVFAALSVHFAGHPDFDAVLAEFDGKGWTKEGAADLVPADDEVTVKREARADRLTEEARNVNGEAEAEVWALRVLFEEMHFEKFGTYPDYDASHEQVKACLAAWTVSKHGRRETPAPSQTEGGGPDDTKQVSKEQGASPSVPPAVTTDGVPVVREGREGRGKLEWLLSGVGLAAIAEAVERQGYFRVEPEDTLEDGLSAAIEFALELAPVSGVGGVGNEARIEQAIDAMIVTKYGDDVPDEAEEEREWIAKGLRAAAPFLVSASDESATRDRVLAAIKETIDLHGAPPLAPTPDLEPSYSTLYRLVVAALDKKGQDDG